MKLIAVNGSPRKKWNTATLLEHALKGAESAGAETKLVHLYDLDYKGCISCFACKLKGGKSFGKCAVNDDLAPLLEEIRTVDALILGSPIYFGDVTGEMRSFLERLFFQFPIYEPDATVRQPNKVRTAWVYTMNVTEELAKQMGYDRMFRNNAALLERFFGPCESLMCYDTLQFDDYSKYAARRFDPVAKRKRHEEVFPEDCKRAYELGVRLVR
ncbi:flavodoxin family protein [Acetomicrobium sp.]|uniref:flavodoxin family protein n=1 Tax=Acetomicrobium sp. TaxID=1872099 RepID=UPI001BCB5CE7|nr:flavodoxin family protein [Acetomicrobium sp.]